MNEFRRLKLARESEAATKLGHATHGESEAMMSDEFHVAVAMEDVQQRLGLTDLELLRSVSTWSSSVLQILARPALLPGPGDPLG